MSTRMRTRLQISLREKELADENKRARLAARANHTMTNAKKTYEYVADDDDNDDDDVIVVDEAEYFRRVYRVGDCSPEINDDCTVVEHVNVKGEDGYEGCGDGNEEYRSLGMNPGSVGKGGVNNDVDGCESSVELGSTSENGDDEHELNDEDFLVDEAELCNVSSADYSSSDGSESGAKRKVKIRNKEGEDDTDEIDDCLEKPMESTYDENNKLYLQWPVKRGEYGGNRNQDEKIQTRVDNSMLYLQWPVKRGRNCRNRSHGESSKKNEPGNSGGGKAPANRNSAIECKPDYGGNRGGGVPMSENWGNSENASKRKRGRPRKYSNATFNSSFQRKEVVRKLKPSEAENIMLNTILKNGNAGLNSCGHSGTESQNKTSLALKFRFGVQESLSEKSEEARELENIFKELEFGLRACDIGADKTSFQDQNDGISDCNSRAAHEKVCRNGQHCLLPDEEIGIRCIYCSFVKLEIRHIMPEFHKNLFGTSKNKTYDRFPSENASANASDNFRIPESNDDVQNTRSNNTQGSVWELIPGIKETLYPHQQEAFEFMWKNIGDGIKLDELGKPSRFGTGGCIICHAPGTGKTRLAITFLESFVRMYPTSKPVIIAPKSVLLTWEEQFARWNIDVPFISMNKNELSGNEDLEFLNHADDVKHQAMIRMTKLYTWATGKGILGISYTLFEKLAGDRKGVDMNIRKVLLEWPGIVVLDEGHTARNDKSNIWNVLAEVKTRRRIMLSGTPFQNNFDELLNTLSLVREDMSLNFGQNLAERRGLTDNVDNDRRIAKLKNMMKPFVHVHKGEILKEKLPGLFHSVVLLKPSELQRTCFRQLSRLKNGLKLDHLVSIASVHPSLLYPCDVIPDNLKVALKQNRKDIDAGVKIRFLFDLINLAQGEKVLVFSQFLTPLKFIGNLLKTRYHWAEERELLYMDGKHDAKQRQTFIRHFNNPKSEARVLLASTKACCEGISLVGASRVVLLDVVWNPSVERQAISRAYRLEQKKDVFVYHLMTSGTKEEDKYSRQVTKHRVSEKVFASAGESKEDEKLRPRVSEDRILEEMIQNENSKDMFAKIMYQHKADELIDSFGELALMVL